MVNITAMHKLLILPILLTLLQAEPDTGQTTVSNPRIVMMGDSITQAWPMNDPEFFSGKPWINKGIGGQTTAQMLQRFRTDVITLKPQIVIIMGGTNDIAGNSGPITLQMTMDNIAAMAKLAKTNKIKPVLCSVLPADVIPWKKSANPADKIITLNQMIKAYANKHKIPYIDYYPVMAEGKALKKEYTGDGVHPNKKGYRAMAPVLKQALSDVLKKKQ